MRETSDVCGMFIKRCSPFMGHAKMKKFVGDLQSPFLGNHPGLYVPAEHLSKKESG
jgi:hypothetical protein